MNVILTGGTGAIGAVLTPYLLNKGHKLTVVDDLSGGFRENLDSRAKFIETDICSNVLNLWLKEQSKEDIAETIVVHLAAVTSLPECEANPLACFKNNVGGTISVLDACVRNNVKNFILASTSAVYEANTSNEPSKEDDDLAPFLAYPLSKKHAEDVCLSYQKKFGLNVNILRLANVINHLGSDKRKSPPLINYVCSCFSKGEGPILHGDGNQSRDWITVFDVCRAFELTLYKTTSGIYNICTGKELSVRTILDLVQRELNIFMPVTFSPAKSLWKDYDIGISPDFVERETNKKTSLSPFLATKELGFRARQDAEEAIREIIRECWVKYKKN